MADSAGKIMDINLLDTAKTSGDIISDYRVENNLILTDKTYLIGGETLQLKSMHLRDLNINPIEECRVLGYPLGRKNKKK